MARRTFGERMAEFENTQDRADWKRRLLSAVTRKDYPHVENLIDEGLTFGYDFPVILDSTYEQLLKKLRK